MTDYIPKPDANFNEWQRNMLAIVAVNLVAWNISEEVFNALKALQSAWDAAHEVASNKHNRTEADVLAKNEARKAFEKAIREFVNEYLAFNKNVSDVERDRMGLTVRSNVRKPAPVPATAPTASIDFSVRLQHTIHFSDENTAKRGKPEGVHGCQIWRKIGGEPPVMESELLFVATDTRSPYTLTYQGDQKGQTVYYWLRWVNTRGEWGPWGATVSAMVVG